MKELLMLLCCFVYSRGSLQVKVFWQGKRCRNSHLFQEQKFDLCSLYYEYLSSLYEWVRGPALDVTGIKTAWGLKECSVSHMPLSYDLSSIHMRPTPKGHWVQGPPAGWLFLLLCSFKYYVADLFLLKLHSLQLKCCCVHSPPVSCLISLCVF